jgi:hypothetical protein
MSAIFFTSSAQALLNAFDARIKQIEPKDKVITWEKSDDWQNYTHKAAEWAKKAWFKPAISNDRLTFNIIKSQNSVVTSLVYAYYHGHLIETFLNHFDKQFTGGHATALPTQGDNCGS